jgi:hypothetical protein
MDQGFSAARDVSGEGLPLNSLGNRRVSSGGTVNVETRS